MLERIPNAFVNYPNVHSFVFQYVRMQFEDVGAMLRLPIKSLGINNACNFASAEVICNLLSGISVTLYQPANYLKPDGKPIGSGKAFKEFVKAFYPDTSPQRSSDVADVLYDQLRNPFAHALGVLDKSSNQLKISRAVLVNADGLSQNRLTEIEESLQRPPGVDLGVRRAGNQWEIVVDFLYRDALDMMVSLGSDAPQMRVTEQRFKAGAYAWRR